MAEFHELTLTDVTPQGRDGVCLTLAVPDDLAETYRFEPGQYLTLRAEIAGEDLRRPYSICSAPGRGFVQVGVKRVEDGRFSNFANDLAPGARLQVMEPEGRFIAPTGGPVNYLLIAAGSGITPMLSIAEATLAGHPDAQVTLVYGNRDTASIMFLERLSDLKDQFLGRFNTVHLLSREQQDATLFNGRIDAGKLTELARVGLIEPKAADGVFVCGPGTMIDMVEMQMQIMGVPADRIHLERFLPADGQAPRVVSEAAREAAEEGVEIETVLDGVRRKFRLTDPDQAVLAAAQSAGIELPFSCAGGMCCTCRCRIVEGAAEMAVNYSLQDWEQEAGFTLACQAHPTTGRLVLDFDAA